MFCSVRERLSAGMKPLEIGIAVFLLVLGMLLGGLAANFWLSDGVKQSKVEQPTVAKTNWPPREFLSPSGWTYLKVDESGWSTGPVGSFQDLDDRLGRLTNSGEEIVIPTFPTVYTPKMVDKPYYDAILQSDIKPGDKVLVIGTGSGADAWVASLKSKALVYVVEINPMAIANARATARLGDFQIRPLVGDITKVALPDDFRSFDFVLWNMPFVWSQSRIEVNKMKIEDNSFHDGDDGTILRSFLAMLPSLLKKGGKALVLNGPTAGNIIPPPSQMISSNRECALFVIPNP